MRSPGLRGPDSISGTDGDLTDANANARAVDSTGTVLETAARFNPELWIPRWRSPYIQLSDANGVSPAYDRALRAPSRWIKYRFRNLKTGRVPGLRRQSHIYRLGARSFAVVDSRSVDRSTRCTAVQLQNVVHQTHQNPLTPNFHQTAPQKPPKTHEFSSGGRPFLHLSRRHEFS